MKNSIQVINSIDWPQLREQKATLLNILFAAGEDDHPLDGILNLIDAMQDAAVADGIAKEEDVYLTEPEEEDA